MKKLGRFSTMKIFALRIKMGQLIGTGMY